MTGNERIALERCCTVLARYDRIMVLPVGLDERPFLDVAPDLKIERFDEQYFASPRGYNLLCRRACFYNRFRDYRYILIYQLDSYVFRDELAYWCAQGYDYIGAPWFNYEHQTQSPSRWIRSPLLRPFLRQVGNGGFSLRRVRTFRRASRWLAPLALFMKSIPEDVFWCNVACRLWPIRIPPVREALRFAFDAAPQRCLDESDRRLPFGCHAWNTVNQEFWTRTVGIGGKGA